MPARVSSCHRLVCSHFRASAPSLCLAHPQQPAFLVYGGPRPFNSNPSGQLSRFPVSRPDRCPLMEPSCPSLRALARPRLSERWGISAHRPVPVMFLLVLPKWPPPGCPALDPVDGMSEPFPTPSDPGYQHGNHSLYASERLGWSLPSAWVGMVPTRTPMTGLFARRWWGCASPISRQLGERPLWSPSSPLGGRLVPPALLPGRSGRAGAHSLGPGRASCPHSSQRSCQPSARSSDFPRQPWAVQRATDRNETPSVQTLAPPLRRRPRRGFPNFKP